MYPTPSFLIIKRTSCRPSPCMRRYRTRTTMAAPLPCRIFSVILLGITLKFVTLVGISHSRFRRFGLGNPRFAFQ